MFKLAEQINPNLANYDLIVGDDTSGRLPALLYWRLANARRRDLGVQNASIRFMNGRYGRAMPADTFPPDSTDSSRALIVTEYVSSGSAALRIYNAVGAQRRKNQVDIAAVDTGRKSLFLESGSTFYFVENIGNYGASANLYGGNLSAKGVNKGSDSPHSYRSLDPLQPEAVQRARQDIEMIADEFYHLLPGVDAVF
jgi:hypothetical protein